MKNIKLIKSLAVGIILLFVGTGIIPSGAQDIEKPALPTSRGNWLYVGGNGPGNYTKIQDAVDNSGDGDTVFVYDDSSPYYENLFIDKSIHLSGENKETTIIDANDSGNSITAQANDILISGFTLQNSDSGISIDKTYNTIITDNIIVHNIYGILCSSSFNFSITKNTFKGNGDGIYLDDWQIGQISDNLIINNSDSGIYCYYANISVSIFNNKIINNGDYGIYVRGLSIDIYNNSIENHGVGIYLEVNYVKIHYNNIRNNTYGIYIDGGGMVSGYFNWISNNNFIGNKIHVTFLYELLSKIVFIILLRPLQLNKFYHNYWDNHKLPCPKMIIGEMDWWGYPSGGFFTLKWFNFDWFPALKPYDIGGQT